MKPTVGRIVHVYYRPPYTPGAALILRPGIVVEDRGRNILVRIFLVSDPDVAPKLPVEEGVPDDYGRYWKWPPRE